MTHGHAPLGERVIGIEIEQIRMIFRFCYINERANPPAMLGRIV